MNLCLQTAQRQDICPPILITCLPMLATCKSLLSLDLVGMLLGPEHLMCVGLFTGLTHLHLEHAAAPLPLPLQELNRMLTPLSDLRCLELYLECECASHVL